MQPVPYLVRAGKVLPLNVSEPRRKRRSQASGALDILNPRFSLHVVAELYRGPRHFNDLLRSIPASGNTLSNRLKLLEKKGIVTREVINYMPPSVCYALTDKGKALAEIVTSIGDWDVHWSSAQSGSASPVAAEVPKPYGKN